MAIFEGGSMEQREQSVSIVIFGASGDLTERKLIPALFSLYRKDRLPERLHIVGLSRTPYTDEKYRDHLREPLAEEEGQYFDEADWQAFSQYIHYLPGNSTVAADFARLQGYLRELERGPANRVYYLSTAPKLFSVIAEQLGAAGMATEDEGWRRVVVEKPFGYDLRSAQELNNLLHADFRESQIYRIDHYMGKETAQNILYFRFANTIFEPLWNRNYIDNVQISVVEHVDIGHRGAYYDQAGVLRDMFQNHLLQLLSLVAMEEPASFEADAVRAEKAKIFAAIRPVRLADTLRAQYDNYHEAKDVAPDSQTPTYAALKLFIDNWRWQGVPFYLRSGKALAAKSSEIIIEFQCPPHVMFKLPPFTPNLLSLCIQPDEGIHLQFQAKVPDTSSETRAVDMSFHYHSYFGDGKLPEAYERLLLDVLQGDTLLFPRSDEIELTWQIIDPITHGWQSAQRPPLHIYERGSWGPVGADEFMERDGRRWWLGCCRAA